MAFNFSELIRPYAGNFLRENGEMVENSPIISKKSIESPGIEQPSTKPNPFPSETINIVSNYTWTSSKFSKLQEDRIPKILLTEYEQNMNSVFMSAVYKMRGIKQDLATFNQKLDVLMEEYQKKLDASTEQDILSQFKPSFDIINSAIKGANADASQNGVYDGLYSARLTGNSYIFPFISSFWGSVTNFWSAVSSTSSLMKGLEQFTSEISKIANIGSPGTAHSETVKQFQPASDGGTYTIQFPLINTLGTDDLRKNMKFIQKFKFQNLQFRETINIVRPPCLYSVEIPGIRWSPVAVVSDFTVSSVGNTRIVDGNIVPELYSVTIKMKELITESQNIYMGAIGGSRVEVLSDRSSGRGLTNTIIGS